MDHENNDKPPEQPAELPTIKIIWNPETQSVSVSFPTKEFKNWDFVCAVVEMAKVQCEDQRKQVLLANMQRQMMEQQKSQAIAQKLFGR